LSKLLSRNKQHHNIDIFTLSVVQDQETIRRKSGKGQAALLEGQAV